MKSMKAGLDDLDVKASSCEVLEAVRAVLIWFATLAIAKAQQSGCAHHGNWCQVPSWLPLPSESAIPSPSDSVEFPVIRAAG